MGSVAGSCWQLLAGVERRARTCRDTGAVACMGFWAVGFYMMGLLGKGEGSVYLRLRGDNPLLMHVYCARLLLTQLSCR
jgi:hypothetical protein